MKWQRIIVFILVSPIVIPFIILVGVALLMVFGVEYALTGKFNEDNGGW